MFLMQNLAYNFWNVDFSGFYCSCQKYSFDESINSAIKHFKNEKILLIYLYCPKCNKNVRIRAKRLARFCFITHFEIVNKI